jgi:hypothetical protein
MNFNSNLGWLQKGAMLFPVSWNPSPPPLLLLLLPLPPLDSYAVGWLQKGKVLFSLQYP